MHKMEKNIPIFLSSDDNYSPFVATTIASICDNTKSNIDFYILDSFISEINKEKILELKKSFNNFNIEFIKIDSNKEFLNIKYINHASHVTISTYNRFLIPKLKPQLKKVLYLDVDIVALGDIKELYDIDMENYHFAAIPESFITQQEDKETKNRLNLAQNHKYFNAGVFVLDNQYWVKNDILNKALEVENNYRGKLKYADQDILNIIFNNNYKILSQKFNLMTQAKTNINDIVIRHFNTDIKPWQYNPCLSNNSLLMDNMLEFWKYAKKTPFYDELYSKVQNIQLQKDNLRKRKVALIIQEKNKAKGFLNV